MGPNGYRTFMAPSLAVACLAHGMPPATKESEDRIDLVEDCIRYANTATYIGRDWSNNVDAERLRRINARGIPFPANKRRPRR